MPKRKNKESVRISKWYKPDDEKVPFRRRNKKIQKPSSTKRGLEPGHILIILSGRYRGKRVVFLKQLKSGLLLVTGPFKINGVPLKRVNQTNVMKTSTKVDLNGVDDNQFVKPKEKKQKKSEDTFFAVEKSPEEKKVDEERKKNKLALQNTVDKALIENIKKVELLKKYLSSRFTITNNMKPHELVL